MLHSLFIQRVKLRHRAPPPFFFVFGFCYPTLQRLSCLNSHYAFYLLQQTWNAEPMDLCSMLASAAEQVTRVGSLTSMEVLPCISISRKLIGGRYRRAVSVTENLGHGAKFRSFASSVFLQKSPFMGSMGQLSGSVTLA